MSRLVLEAQVPAEYDRQVLTAIVRAICTQVNLVAEARIVGHYNADTAAPSSSVVYGNLGDKVWNTSPSETGAGGSKYVVLGWICTASGTPGTWLPMRALTGN